MIFNIFEIQISLNTNKNSNLKQNKKTWETKILNKTIKIKVNLLMIMIL